MDRLYTYRFRYDNELYEICCKEKTIKGLVVITTNPLYLLERETGFEPATFSLGS